MSLKIKGTILEIVKGRQAVYLIIFLFGLLYLYAGISLYLMNFYQDDGFRYFSAIRNSLAGTGNFMYEWPTFQFLFANHTYFILILLIPFVSILKTPIVLLFFGILAILISSLYLFKIAEIKKIPHFYTILLIMLYLGSPMISEAALGFGYNLFQPDVFSAPLILAFVYYYLSGRS